MPFFEQLLYGYSHLDEESGRQELAHSAGMGTDVAAEIHQLCDAWGQAPALGLQFPVLMSHPLRSTMPSMRGRLHTVIRVAAGERPLFHALVLADSTFSAFGRNPYAVAGLVEFRETWNGHKSMDRLEVEPENRGPLVAPEPGPGDVGLIDEAILEFLLTGKLHLPLEMGLRDSERALALIIACLPEKDRKELHFASFTTLKGNAYGITAVETEGATFAGWRRLMLARLDTGVSPQQLEYKDLIATYLTRGDLHGIDRVSARHNFKAPASSQVVTATRAGRDSGTPPPKPPVRPAVSRPPLRPASAIVGHGTGPARPGAGTPGGRRLTANRRDNMPVHGLDPAADAVRPRRASPFRPRVTSAFPGGRRGGGVRFFRLVGMLLLIFSAGWVATMWLDGRTLSESLEWAGLPGMDGRSDRVDQTTTLLEVVDVGQVYTGALKYTGGGGLGLNAAGDKGRQKALGRLQSEATSPLLDQVALFADLTRDGILEGARADRESERLETLSRQGNRLDRELDRLELAWYSFTTGTNWRDLGKLNDKAVAARRDSLERAEPGSMADVRLAMGAGVPRSELTAARAQMDGMAAVVRLFQAPRWSEAWERDLAKAAGQVPPSTGKTTRAYRNAAFAMLRLKRAEREAANRSLPFSSLYDAKAWPTAEVAEILPLLRKEAGRLADRTAPPLLAGTVGLYAALASPEATIDRISGSATAWQQLQENAAVRFDPELYLDFLDRLRYEAALRRSQPHGDVTRIPAHLCGDAERSAFTAFADSLATLTRSGQWQAMAARTDDPFFRRWATHLAGDLDARLARLRREFDDTWEDCRTRIAALQGDVRAGYDWSERWRDLHAVTDAAHAAYGEALAEDPVERPRLQYLQHLNEALDAPRPLRLARATVRLDPAALSGPTDARLEIRAPLTGQVWSSETFTVGPAAPEGTGWVGTMFLDWAIPVSGRQVLTGHVVAADGSRELLAVSYPSLAQGGGPAAMVRPVPGATGSIAIKAELEDWWGGLEIPDLGLVF